MRVSELGKLSAEKIRTDPAGFACLAAGLALPKLLENYQTDENKSLITLASLGLMATGIIHLSNMFEYSKAIETSLRTVGFEATEFRVRAYCLRQVGRVVCEKTGHFQEFVDMYKKKDKRRYSFIPHI